MKKFIAAVLCAGLIAIVSAGCGYTDALNSQNSTTAQDSQTSTEDTAVKEVNADDFEDSFSGLCQYFANMGYIKVADKKIDETKVTKMDVSLIGAKEGNKYATDFGGKSITIELYSFDIKNLNDTANSIIDSVKKDGTFSILDLAPVKAYLSDNGKYLMIYTDESIDDENPDTNSSPYQHREEVIKNFTEFHK